jgi:hypothetical protein
MIIIKTQIGKSVIEVSAETAKQAIKESAFFQSLPSTCPVCDSLLKFTHRTPQDFEFFGLECTGEDHHSTNFGQNKNGKDLFYKYSDKWTSYKDRQKHNPEPPQQGNQADETAPDDVPPWGE